MYHHPTQGYDAVFFFFIPLFIYNANIKVGSINVEFTRQIILIQAHGQTQAPTDDDGNTVLEVLG